MEHLSTVRVSTARISAAHLSVARATASDVISVVASAVAAALAVAACVLTTGCGSNLPYTLSEPATHAPTVTEKLAGQFQTTDGSIVQLADSNQIPTIIVFSQDTCAVCGHEADALRDSLGSPAGASGGTGARWTSTRVHLYTILVGSIAQDAVDWKGDHRIPWTVGIDPDASLFSKYCTKHTVPCNVVYLPGKGVVLRKHGASERSELESLTGPWENSI